MAGRSKEELLASQDTRTLQHDLGVYEERFDWEPISWLVDLRVLVEPA